MQQNLPPRRRFKLQAKRCMMNPLCLRVTLVLVGIQLALVGVRYLTGGTLTYGLVSLASYGDTTSGFYTTAEGFSLIFRMDLTGMVLAIPVTYAQLRLFLIINVVCFVILAPLRLGAMEVYWKVLRGEQPVMHQIFRWFTQAGRLVKALVVEFVLEVVVRVITFVLSLPAFYLYYLFYTTTPSLASYTTMSSLLQLGGTVWAILAALVGFFLHCCFLPVRYCLAAHPEYSLGTAFRRGIASIRGVRRSFFRFRLSYILFFFLSQLTYGAMDFYVTPYTSLGSMVFIQEVARFCSTASRPPQEPEQPTEGNGD